MPMKKAANGSLKQAAIHATKSGSAPKGPQAGKACRKRRKRDEP
jgi:hypothetical protein